MQSKYDLFYIREFIGEKLRNLEPILLDCHL